MKTQLSKYMILLATLVISQTALAMDPPKNWNKPKPGNNPSGLPKSKPQADLKLPAYPSSLATLKPLTQFSNAKEAKGHEKQVSLGEQAMAQMKNVAYATNDNMDKVFDFYTKTLVPQGFEAKSKSAVGGEGGQQIMYTRLDESNFTMKIIAVSFFPAKAFHLYLAPGEKPPAGANGITINQAD